MPKMNHWQRHRLRKGTHFAAKPDQNRGDVTRDILLQTATSIFARDGYDATGTRAIADAAGVNQALISYHFGNKHGLYLAVFENIAAQINIRFGNSIVAIKNTLTREYPTKLEARNGYFDALIRLCSEFIDMLSSDDSIDKSRLMMREQQSPTEAFDIVYGAFIGPSLQIIGEIFTRLRPDLNPQQIKLLVISFFGQMIAIRATRSSICRFMDWPEIGKAEAELYKNQMQETARALLLRAEL
ncbi:MAG: CerR family C-terminal domain-containing protein [Pseudomonadota bacterium]